LEENLDMKLMFREGNAIRLTEIGVLIFDKCDLIFRQIKGMEDELEDMSRAKSGVLRIGSPQTPAKYIMPNLLARFKKTYPGIRIILSQGTSSEMIKSLFNHTNELAVVRCMREEKILKIKTFGSEELVLVTAPKSKNCPTNEISVSQLSAIPLILQKEGSATRAVLLEYLQKFRVTPLIALESDSTDLIKELVIQDNGVCFMVRSAVKDDIENKILKSVNILEGSLTIEYGISYLNRKALSPAAWAFLRLLEKAGEKNQGRLL
jgi:DNA-binding transcriptional LysR family regulator